MRRLISTLLSTILVISIVLNAMPLALAASVNYSSTPAGTYSIVTDISQLNDGDTIFIASQEHTCAMSITQNTKNRGYVPRLAYTNQEITLNYPSNVQGLIINRLQRANGYDEFTLQVVSDSGEYYLNDVGSNTSTHLLLTSNYAMPWAISFDDSGNALITSTDTHKCIYKNKTSSIFATYVSGQVSVQIYKLNSVDCQHENYSTTVLAQPDCTSEGLAKYTCSDCNYSWQETLPITEHSFESINVVNATCIEPEVTTFQCTLCGLTKIEETAAPTGHNFISGACTYCGELETTIRSLEFELVTDESDLYSGATILIVARLTSSSTKLVALSTTQKTNNRDKVDLNVDFGSTIELTSDVQAEFIKLESNNVDFWSFKVLGGYLYAAANNANYLRTQEINDPNGRWAITFDEDNHAKIIAQGMNSHSLMRYYASSKIFSCYSTDNSPNVYIYKLVEDNPGDICLHRNKQATLEIAPTCTSVGYAAGIICLDCGITLTGREEIPIIEHNYDITCNNNGTHTFTCIICGYNYTESCRDYYYLDNDQITCDICGYTAITQYYTAVKHVSNGDKIILGDVNYYNEKFIYDVTENKEVVSYQIFDDQLDGYTLYVDNSIDYFTVEDYDNGSFHLTYTDPLGEKYYLAIRVNILVLSKEPIDAQTGRNFSLWQMEATSDYITDIHLHNNSYNMTFFDGLFALDPSCFHNDSISGDKEPDCLKPGFSNAEYCENCGLVWQYDSYINALGHDFAIESIPATCHDYGVDNMTCSRCGETEQTITPPTNMHIYGVDNYCTICGQLNPSIETDFSGRYYIAALLNNEIYYMSTEGTSDEIISYSISYDVTTNTLVISTTTPDGHIIGQRSFTKLTLFDSEKIFITLNDIPYSYRFFVADPQAGTEFNLIEYENAYKIDAIDLAGKSFKLTINCDLEDEISIRCVDAFNRKIVISNSVINVFNSSTYAQTYSLNYSIVDFRYANIQNDLNMLPNVIDTNAQSDYTWTLNRNENGTYSLRATYKGAVCAYIGNPSSGTAPFSNIPAEFNIKYFGNNAYNIYVDNESTDSYLLLNAGHPRFAFYDVNSPVDMTIYLIPVTSDVVDCQHETTKLVGAKEATCKINGYTGDIVCSECGLVIVSGSTILAHHTASAEQVDINNSVAATCTSAGYTQYVVRCLVCNEIMNSRRETISRLNHTIVNDYCTMCHNHFGVASVSMDLRNDIRLAFNIDVLPATQNVYAEFEFIGLDTPIIITEHTVDLDGHYKFEFPCENPKLMTEKVYITIYAVDNNTPIATEQFGYSIRDYCEDMIKDNPDDTNLNAMLGTLLHYGDMVQIYEDYNTDNLATSLEEGLILTINAYMPQEEDYTEILHFGGSEYGYGYDSMLDWYNQDYYGTGELCTIRPYLDVEWGDMDVILSNDITLRCYFTVYSDDIDIDSLIIRTTLNGRVVEFTSDDFNQVMVASKPTYYIDYNDIGISELDDVVLQEFYYDNMRIGTWRTWSFNRLPLSYQSIVEDESTDTSIVNMANVYFALYSLGLAVNLYYNP